MPNNRRFVGFAAFTAVFAVLAAIVFWGAWSPNVAIYAPDDGYVFSLSYADTCQRWLNNFVTTGKAHPLDLLWSGLLGSPMFTAELRYAVPLYLSALALAFFLRGRGLSPFSSYGAGLLLAVSGYWCTLFSAGHGNWFVWMSYGVFSFGLIDRALERGKLRYWLLLGVTTAWASFYMPDVWLLFALFAAAYFVFRAISLRVFPWKKSLIAAAVFLFVGAPSFYSAFVTDIAGRDKQISEASRSPETANSSADDARWTFITNWSLPPNEVAEFVCPRLHGDTSCPITLSLNGKKGTRPYTGALGRMKDADSGNYRQHSLYIGVVTVVLALVGVVLGKRREVCFFAVAAAIFLVLSFGRYCEFVYRGIYLLPFGDYLRAPVKWLHLTELAMAILAGFGLEVSVSRAKKSGSALVRRYGLVVIAATVLAGAGMSALNANLFCTPIDYTRAVNENCSAKLTILGVPPEYASNSRVARAIARENGFEDMVFVAPYFAAPHASVVQILTPLKPVSPKPVKGVPLTLGILSVITACGAVCWSLYELILKKE